jgi:hypothetical protein
MENLEWNTQGRARVTSPARGRPSAGEERQRAHAFAHGEKVFAARQARGACGPSRAIPPTPHLP